MLFRRFSGSRNIHARDGENHDILRLFWEEFLQQNSRDRLMGAT
jgi:hypothetical protein